MSEKSFDTLAVQAGTESVEKHFGAVSVPIYNASLFAFRDAETGARIHNYEQEGYFYSRLGNPTTDALERALCELERGKDALCFASGMAAITTTILGLVETGAHIVAPASHYATTGSFLQFLAEKFGVETTFVDAADAENYKLAVRPNTKIFYLETPANPTLQITDIAEVARLARESGAISIADNTFATPFNQNPLALGADLVVHSATKFLGGHADATGGVVIAREEFDRAALMGALTLTGGILSAWEAHSILRGLKTLGLRLEKQCRNAEKLAEFFLDCPQIEKVIYPALANEEEAEVVNRILRKDFRGAVLGIKLKHDSREAVYRFMNALNLCTRAASVGDIFTGVVHPATATHREMSAAKRARLGITEGLLRVSAGIEEVEDIIADIEQAFVRTICGSGWLKTDNYQADETKVNSCNFAQNI